MTASGITLPCRSRLPAPHLPLRLSTQHAAHIYRRHTGKQQAPFPPSTMQAGPHICQVSTCTCMRGPSEERPRAARATSSCTELIITCGPVVAE